MRKNPNTRKKPNLMAMYQPLPPKKFLSALAPLQHQFELDGGRSNQLLSLVNNTDSEIQLTEISFKSNADIQNPWGALGTQWSNSTRVQQGDFYIYQLSLNPPIILQPGKNKMLEYSAQNALGPIAVDMPPRAITVKSQGSDPQKLTSIYSNNPGANPHSNIEFNMYHANWGQYAYKKDISTEDFSDINCLSYAFIGFDSEGKVSSLDAWADQLDLVLLALKKQQFPYLKTSLSFGGWTNGGKRMDTVFSQMAADPDERKKFVENAVRAVLIADADGIDIDWEFVKKEDADNYVLLLQELRDALTNAKIPNARVSIAAPAGIDNIQIMSQQQWQAISNVVDRISVMNYDYFGAFSDFSDFHSAYALSPNSQHAQSGGNSAHYCVEKTIAAYDALQVPRNKIAMGIPNYARGMIVEKVGDFGGMYQKIVGTPKGDFGDESGIYSWDTIQKFLNKQPSALDNLGVTSWSYYDSSHAFCIDAKMCFLSGELPDGTCVVINFLDPKSAKWRAEQAQVLGLGGVMMWANYEDDQDNSIAHAVSQGLNVLPSAPTLQFLQSEMPPPPSYQSVIHNSLSASNYFDAARSDVIQPPPSYQQVMGNVPPPPSYQQVMGNVPPPPSYEEVLNNLSDIEKFFYEHMLMLSRESDLLAAEKYTIMFDLFSKRNSLEEMQKSFNRTKLSEHRNPIKYAATKILGENISCKLFSKPKSVCLAERLMEEAQAKMLAMNA